MITLIDCSKNKKSSVLKRLIYFFFFQAEDGIRDIGVTGVQTCALPILRLLGAGGLADVIAENMKDRRHYRTEWELPDEWLQEGPLPLAGGRTLEAVATRSEERRGGKECRSRWSPYH